MVRIQPESSQQSSPLVIAGRLRLGAVWAYVATHCDHLAVTGFVIAAWRFRGEIRSANLILPRRARSRKGPGFIKSRRRMEYAVNGETRDGRITIVKRGFASHEEAEDHPIRMSRWKRV